MWSKKELIDKQAEFWVLMARGSTLIAACEAVGVDRRTGRRWRQASGGLIPRKRAAPSGRYLSLEERLRIADGQLAGTSVRAIATAVGRSASTVSRELRRNGPGLSSGRRGGAYAPYAAQKRAELRARRPKASKFDDARLASVVQAKLCVKWSPEQISLHLAARYGDRAEMRVCHETIYQALFVQGRGHLRADLHRHLRTGRAVRRPHGLTKKRASKIPDMILISERPAEVADRAVPGHWEGDLILGSNCRSAIATLVERHSRYTMLVHLPDNHGAETVRDGLLATIQTLPAHLRKSLTWDQGTELTKHREITLATSMDIYFCDPHSPWQRGSNENTNGLLRQYFPKGTDLSVHSPQRLLEVATELNARPRKTLGGITPAMAMQRLLRDPHTPIGATA